MDSVKLVVQVDRAQLNTLQADVKALQNQTIKLSVDASGAKALNQSIEAAAASAQKLNANLNVSAGGLQAANQALHQIKTDTDGNIQTTDRWNLSIGKTRTIIEETGADHSKTTEIIRENYDQQRKAAETAAQQEARYAAEAKKYLLEEAAAAEKVAAAQEKIAAANPTKLQQKINYATGLDPDYSPKITAANSMFGKLTDDQFEAYTTGAKTAAEVTGKLETAQTKAATAAKNQSFAQSKVNQDLSEGSYLTKILGNTLDVIVTKVVAWQVINAGVAALIGSFRDAIQTMKAVDDQLVVVRKVTGYTADEMKRVEEQAYATATAYGVSADAYLESVASFARAGYRDQSEALAELAVKTQLVGDTTAEVANQFLLSVDKAYQYQGSIEKLSAVLDGANELDNKYATSIEKIAEGLGTVAPVAAQANVGIDELSAAIGTITAVTQRSGTEAARALRALMLNIIGDTKTEIDEGVTWTTGEIANLRDVIKTYAPEAYKAAQATGSIIDPMEAIGGLAQAMKDGLLTEQQLMETVSDIGGKLRTSQLLALIQNWDMYQSMLADYGNALGSADAEVANALDSWTRKTEQLKNAWTEFISHLIDTGIIKDGIDLLTAAVKLLDNEFSQTVVVVGAVAVAFSALKKVITALDITKNVSEWATVFRVFFTTVTHGTVGAQAAFSGLWATISASPLAVIALVSAGIYAIVKAVDALTVTYEEQLEVVNDLNNEFQKQYGAGSEYDQLKSKVENLTEKERERLRVLEGQRIAAEAALHAAERLAAQKWLDENSRSRDSEFDYENGGFVFGDTKDVENLNALKDQIAEINALYEQGEPRVEDYNAALANLVSTNKDYYDGLIKARDFGFELTDEEQEFIRLYEEKAKAVAESAEATETAARATDRLAESAGNASGAIETLKTAMEEAEKKSSLTYGTLADLEKLFPGLSAKIMDANGSLTAEGKAALATKDAFVDLISQQIVFNNTTLDVNGKIAALQALAAQAGLTNAALANVGSSESIQREIVSRMQNGESREAATQKALANYAARLTPQVKAQEYIPTSSSSGSSSRSSGGSSGSTKDAELERRKQAVADEKAVYELMVKQGKSAAELEAQIRKVQDALHQQKLRMEELKESTSDQLAISAEWWTWDEKRLQNYEKEQKAAEDVAKQQLAVYQQNVTINQKQLQIVQAIGAGSEAELAVARKLTASYSELLAQQQAQGASQDDIYATALNLIKAKKDELSLEQSITEEIEAQAEKQRELDEKYLSDTVKLRKSDVDLAQKLGLSTEEIVYYMRRYADAIAEQGRAMQASGAAQADINALAVTYLGVLEDIYDLENGQTATDGQDKHLDFLKDVVSLRNSELSLMEAMELSDDEQIRKYRGILDALRAQGDYQKKINAAQEEQNKTATDYYNTLQKILSLQKSQLDDLLDAATAYLDEQEAAATGPLQEQLDLLKAQHDEAKAQREEDEKLLSVEKARQALENAKKPIGRVWNSSKGVWEQLADASAVESAEEALLKAQEELAEYQYQLQIDALQSEINALEKTFDTMRDAIEDAAEGIKNGEYTYEEAYQYIASQMKALYDGFSTDEKTVYDNHNAALTEAMNGAVTPFRDVAGEIQTTYDQIKTTALSFGEIDSVLTEKSEELSGDLDRLRLSLADGFGALGTDLDRADYTLQDAANSLAETANLLSLLPGSLRSILEGLGTAANDVQKLTAGGADVQSVIDQMRSNSIAWHNDVANRAYYEAENQRLGASIGATYRNGAWYGSDGNLLYDITGYTGNTSPTVETPVQVSGGSASSVYASDPDDRDGNGVPDWLDSVSPSDGGGGAGGYDPFAAPEQTQSYSDLDAESEIRRIMSQYGADYSYARRLYELNLARGYAAYDRGGVLHGLGGIKATREDEAVLPPDITKAILKPGLTETVAARLNELGILTGARNATGTLNLRAGNSIGTQNNGDTININGLDVSTYVNRGTTLGEIADIARNLDIY